MSYAATQDRLDAEYRKAWQTPEVKAWAQGLPQEKRKLAHAKCSPTCTQNGCGHDEDAASFPSASITPPRVQVEDSLDAILADYPHIADEIERRATEIAGGIGTGTTAEALLRRIALLFIDRSRRALHADCLAFVAGLTIRMGESGSSLARRHGITRQAFHARCNSLLRDLELAPSRNQKSLASREEYRASNRRW
jgi:hypothetical protein